MQELKDLRRGPTFKAGEPWAVFSHSGNLTGNSVKRKWGWRASPDEFGRSVAGGVSTYG